MHKLKLISDWKIAVVLSLLFFVVAVITLPDYGINWDTINHLPRGQAYLHYFLTGNKDYNDLPEWSIYWQNPQSLSINANLPSDEVKGRSFYESVGMPFTWMIQHEGGSSGGGHPPLSDILSSVFNVVLFQNLGIINDIDSYRVYSILLASLLVGLIYKWVASKYGKLPALISALSLALYPLFWAESHFNNEKDIPETVFISFMIFFFWQGIVQEKWKKVLISGLFFGLALGTKFNVLFVPFIILPWLTIYWWGKKQEWEKGFGRWFLSKRSLFFSSVAALAIGSAIFIFSWPYLWTNTISRVAKVVGFYKEIGLTANINQNYVGPFKINTYPIQWIAYTTPPIILILTLIGIISIPKLIRKDNEKLSLLILLWLAIPILRVTAPGTTIYGGIRQIMEYIPPLAILSGIGTATILGLLKKRLYRFIAIGLIVLGFSFNIYRLISIHPNENVYFNFLIGGLKGAKERNIPSWGNTFGAAYREGIIWINKNAEPGSSVVMAHGLMPNIPKIWLRSDLNFTNSLRSGYLRQGEYAISLTSEGTDDSSYYDTYLSKFMKPVYEVKVDGVDILEVWKNDNTHLISPWNEENLSGVKMTRDNNGLTFDLGQVERVSRLEIDYQESSCQPLSSGYVRYSVNGKDWGENEGKLPQSWRIATLGQQPKDGKFLEPFVGQEIRYIKLGLSPQDACLNNVVDYKVFAFK